MYGAGCQPVVCHVLRQVGNHFFSHARTLSRREISAAGFATPFQIAIPVAFLGTSATTWLALFCGDSTFRNRHGSLVGTVAKITLCGGVGIQVVCYGYLLRGRGMEAVIL
jgi:hypothetical protein